MVLSRKLIIDQLRRISLATTRSLFDKIIKLESNIFIFSHVRGELPEL